jgi:hypothetical protein
MYSPFYSSPSGRWFVGEHGSARSIPTIQNAKQWFFAFRFQWQYFRCVFYLLNQLSHFYYTLVFMIAKFISLLYFWLMICSLGCLRQSNQPGNQIPFINSANPVMSLVSHSTLFLGSVGYKVMHFYIQIWILKCLNAFTLVFTGLLYGPVMRIHLYYKP